MFCIGSIFEEAKGENGVHLKVFGDFWDRKGTLSEFEHKM